MFALLLYKLVIPFQISFYSSIQGAEKGGVGARYPDYGIFIPTLKMK